MTPTSENWWLDALTGFGMLFDSDGRILDANAEGRASLAMVGVTREDPHAIRELLTGLLVKPDQLDFDEIRAAVLASGRWGGSVLLRERAGTMETYDVQVISGGADTYLVFGRSRREQALRTAAEEERAATEEYLARLGHELRTPLNAVLGFAQLLDLEPLEGSQRESVEHILTAGRHMATLLDEVLDLARIRGGGVDLDVAAVPVLDVVQSVVDLVAPLANRKGIVRYIEPATPAVALADRTRLWQVILNLVSNAVKYGRDGGQLRVGVSVTPAGRTRIEVEDDGAGMVTDALDRIFRPFDRLGAERSGIEGTGLGLALAKALVTAMDGTLEARSAPGRGTTMIVELATVDAADLATANVDESSRSRRYVVHAGADTQNQALVAQAVRTRLRGTPVTVDRVELASDVVRRTQPAVVVISDDLPDGSAVELLHRLGSNPLTALIPVVVLSQGAEDLRVLMRLRAAGAASILSVPLDMRELLDVIGRFLDQAPE
jgi:signal transduction histidine kinase